jgi:hypothetical protein
MYVLGSGENGNESSSWNNEHAAERNWGGMKFFSIG